jgi:uncharacterized protein with FMN-binding domain
MKKIILSLGVVLVFAFYAVLANRSSVSTIAANPAAMPATTLLNRAPTPTPQPQPTAGAFKDGSYAGPVTDAFYGSVQVKAVIKNAVLADVQFLQYPVGTGTTRRINAEAMPQLTQEAIAAQSANVDIISGATQTSDAFRQSLAAALAMAK